MMREFAIDLAIRTGELLLGFQRRGLAVPIATKRSHMDLVTEADLAAERFIRENILARYPDHDTYGEESATGGLPDTEWIWVIDPIDGTGNFSHGVPLFAVNLGVLYAGNPVIGVTHAPALGATFWAEDGSGAWLRREGSFERLHVSATEELSRSLIATGFPYDRATAADNNLTEFVALDRLAQGVRRLGTASLSMAWVAAGGLDAYWESRAGVWDWIPGTLLVREAGGEVTDFSGHPWLTSSSTMIASNGKPALHEQMRLTILDVRTRQGLGETG